uniref:Endonuclease/exonuclease/phosphatase domain-containing protein n=1 Tax=Acrobeloides nanus TaxID=290746 RepID=A0A914DCK6_9BILA
MSISINISPAESLHPQRHWITLDEGKEFHENLKFRVCTYNLLDTKHAKRDKYDYCIDEVLSWGYRKSLIIKQVLDYSPDLMSFQEVEPAMYNDLKLELKNYDSTYFQKTPYSRKKDKKNPKEVELYKIPIIFCGTHIYWNPEFVDVKLIQTMILLSELKEFRCFIADEIDEEKIPMIIAGDFNSIPKSSVFSYITKGYLLRTNKELGPFLGKNYLDSLSDSNDPRFYQHGLKLDSLSQQYVPFTNFWTKFKDTLDYIFSTPDLLCLKVLGPIDDKWYINNRIIGFPNEFVPSDHIPVVVEYAYVMEE